MIYDTIDNLDRYGADPCLQAAFDFIRAHRDGMPTGSYPIRLAEPPQAMLTGAMPLLNEFCNVQEYQTVADKQFEVHEWYIDVMYVVEGHERILAGQMDMSRYEPMVVDGQPQDCMLFDDLADPVELDMRAGSVCVFFPGEAHKPGLDAPGQQGGTVRKFVAKVPFVRAEL